MLATSTSDVSRTCPDPRDLDGPDACQVAAARLYQAEMALHCARQSGVDAWMKAAGEKLHEAIESHSAAVLRAA